MKLYKLENNTLIESPDTLIVGGNGILNPTEDQLRSVGYKTLIIGEYPDLKWYETISEIYSEENDNVLLTYNITPKDNLLSLYTEKLTNEMNYRLENDFFWAGKCVKLSESNQNDYGNMYTLLSNNRNFIPAFQYNFKNNTPHFFKDFDELNDFGISTISFVNNQLIQFRAEIHKIKDYTNDELYNYLKLNNK